jgi:ABC-type glycerol-3-phosphate transport system substrate-binding protein
MRASSRFLTLATILAAVAVATTCGGDATGPAVPTSITLVSGNGQSGVVGQALPNALVVKVVDASGAGVPGVTVNWSVTSGGGSLSATSTTTDQSGQALVTLTPGPIAGTNTVSATVAQLTPIIFSVTGTPATPAKLAFSVQPTNV